MKHSYTVGAGAPSLDAEPTYSKWHSHWALGIVGETDVAVAEICPSGNATIKEKITFVNGLIGSFTGLIWKPTTVKVWCGDGAASSAAAPDADEVESDEDYADDADDEEASLELQLSPEQMRALARDPRVQEWVHAEVPSRAAELQATLAAHQSE